MKVIAVIVIVLLLLAGGVAIYFYATTPRAGGVVSMPLTPAQRALLANVPESADAFALIPHAAAFDAKLRSNSVTREAVDEWSRSHVLPRPWMIGAADLVVWRSGGRTSYALNLDPVRALVCRLWIAASDVTEIRSNRSTLIINPTSEPPMAAADLDALLALAKVLPAGDALAVQRENARGAFPPIGRPAATTVRITADSISIASRTSRLPDRPASGAPIEVRFPRGSMLTAAFSAPPRAVDDMNRLVGAKVSALLRDGGEIVVYDVEGGKLLPRPREVIVLPATPERRAALQDFAAHVVPDAVQQALGFHVETADTGTQLLLAFDRDSIDRYRADTLDSPMLPANSWSMRVDPKRAVPMLEQITDNVGLRFLAPRLFRSARDLNDWIDHLKNAKSIEAADSVSADGEDLRVLITVR